MDRFAMAEALVSRARKHAAWIGDDHGDPYEVAMLADEIGTDLQVTAKEILDHLRAALDYCARQVWQDLSAAPLGAIIYFPIAREGAKASDFASLMNAKMPGVPSASPSALAAFADMQAFADPANIWLPELATLGNSAKHEHLQVAIVPEALIHMRRDENGTSWTSFEPGHGPKRHHSWMALLQKPGGTPEHMTYEARYLVLGEINVELAHYLKQAIGGVERVIARCRTLTEVPD
ncbi:hypothetical protein Q4F19_08330 [Sphingomonas sp. BIUV-7]|uniref:Uncharacterized protein n=1 Tax=Sphingomonas natans TaxID=3063330 RepID=A0ABT8Y7T4_9SPHN|nr:hypothetical protein [Sphingomonas sp. BIUV-7]MDO6414385.1 hypothetical protein [Sphingomonas sp. BIUV-7]